MSKNTVGDVLVERLISWNMEVIFGCPDDGMNGIFDAPSDPCRQDSVYSGPA